MAGDIDDQRYLEAEHIAWIEWAERNQETSGPATIRQLIQHSAKFGTCEYIDFIYHTREFERLT